MIDQLKKVFIFSGFFFLVLSLFSNVNSKELIETVKEPVVDIDGNVVYKAIHPQFADMCIELRLPINLTPEVAKDRITTDFEAKMKSKSTMISGKKFQTKDLVVSYGECQGQGQQKTSSACADQRLLDLPMDHQLNFFSYSGDKANSHSGALQKLCSQLPLS